MIERTRRSWHLYTGRAREEIDMLDSNVWELLDNFVKQLQNLDEIDHQLRLLLQMVRQSTRADVVYVASLQESQPVELIGQPFLTPEWCRQCLRTLLEQTPGVEGHVLCSSLPAFPLSPAPESLALVRLSQTRSVWLTAVSFAPGRRFQQDDIQLMRLARRILIQRNQHTQMYDRLKDTLFGLVRCLTASLDARDPYTWGHSERVARSAVRLAQQMNLPDTIANDLYLGGLLHDIGKIGVPDEVLRKPSRLTTEEKAVIEQHTVIGDAILSHVTQLAHLRPIIRNHHEQWDGRGYPDEMAGEAIPLEARIVAVADACDAMLSDRPYRDGMSPERVEQILREGAGGQWDPNIIQHFLACRHELYAIHQRGLGDSVIKAVEQALQMGNNLPSGARSLCSPMSYPHS